MFTTFAKFKDGPAHDQCQMAVIRFTAPTDPTVPRSFIVESDDPTYMEVVGVAAHSLEKVQIGLEFHKTGVRLLLEGYVTQEPPVCLRNEIPKTTFHLWLSEEPIFFQTSTNS